MNRTRIRFLVPAALCLAAACSGPDGRPGTGDVDGGPGSGPDANPSDLSTITGTVWAPASAPGMVPAGHEIPVFDALVYLSVSRPDPIDSMAHCMPCSQAPANGVTTDADGRFTLRNVVPNTYWLVIEKGQFRLEQELVVGVKSTIDLSAPETTLPSTYDPQNGKWIPKIALASGIFDDMEDILGKIGIGEVDGSGQFIGSSAAGIFDVYSNGGAIDSYATDGMTLEDLVTDLNRMLQYHIIFIPCSGSSHTGVLSNPDQQVLRNIRDYVAAGGKLYVTDWSGEWSDNVFPAQVELQDFYDTPASAYDPVTDTWDPGQFGSANGSPSYSSNAQASEDNLRMWLDGQAGPVADGGEGPFDPMNMDVRGNWNHIEGLHSVEVGVDDEGSPIVDDPVDYIIGDDGTAGGLKPLTVTFEPAGCGRVLYSTYHTTHSTHVGLVPQERVLVYLIMEIGVCKSGPIVD